MENIPYIVSETSATLIYEGKPYTLSASQPNFAPFKKALLNGDFETAINYLDIKTSIKEFSDGELSIKDGAQSHRGLPRSNGSRLQGNL